MVIEHNLLHSSEGKKNNLKNKCIQRLVNFVICLYSNKLFETKIYYSSDWKTPVLADSPDYNCCLDSGLLGTLEDNEYHWVAHNKMLFAVW